MFTTRTLLSVSCCACLMFGCGGGDAVSNAMQSAATPPRAAAHDAAVDASSPVDAASAPDAGHVSADPFALPPNSSFESAQPLTLGADARQRVVSQSQVDYYSFEARAGALYVLTTDVSEFSPNNVITVFDPDRTKIAENDSGSLYPTDHVDARLIVRPERSGRYYVVVEDRGETGGDPQGRFVPPLFYKLTFREITPDTEGFAIESGDQSPSQLALLHDAATRSHSITLIGELSEDDRADTFEIQGMPDYALIGELRLSAVDADGALPSTLSVRVTAQSDGHLLASASFAAGHTSIHPPVDDGKYRIEITAGEHLGASGFYAVDLTLLPDNPHERTEAENNSISSAVPLMLNGSSKRRGLLLSRLSAQDIDYYRFEATKGELARVQCEGESGGSGVRGLRAELLAPTMQPLVDARELSTKPLYIEPFELTTSGTYYLKLSSETPPAQASDVDAVEPWARCAVIVGH